MATPFTIGLEKISVTIANGQSLSPAIGLGAKALFAIAMPSGWDAAAITFQAATDDSTWLELYDDTGTAISITTAASRYVVLSSPVKLLGVRGIKVRSGTSGAAVNQTADRVLGLMVLPL